MADPQKKRDRLVDAIKDSAFVSFSEEQQLRALSSIDAEFGSLDSEQQKTALFRLKELHIPEAVRAVGTGFPFGRIQTQELQPLEPGSAGRLAKFGAQVILKGTAAAGGFTAGTATTGLGGPGGAALATAAEEALEQLIQQGRVAAGKEPFFLLSTPAATSGEAIVKELSAATEGALSQLDRLVRPLILSPGAQAGLQLGKKSLKPAVTKTDKDRLSLLDESAINTSDPKRSQELFEEFGIEPTPGQRTLSPKFVRIEATLRRFGGADAIFRNVIDIPQARRLVGRSLKLLDELSPRAKNLSDFDFGVFLRNYLNGIKRIAGKRVKEVDNLIEAEVPGMVSEADISGLLSRIRSLKTQLDTTVSGLNEVAARANIAQAEKLLTGLENNLLGRVVAGADAATAVQGAVIAGRPSLVGLIKQRRLLQDFAFSGNIQKHGKQAIKELSAEINNTVDDALRANGRDDIANLFRKNNAEFSFIATKLDSAVLKKIVKTETPEKVLAMIDEIGPQSVFRALSQIASKGGLPKEKVALIQAKWLERRLRQASIPPEAGFPRGIPIATKFNAAFADKPMLRAVFFDKPDFVKKLDRYLELLNLIEPKAELTKTPVNVSQTLLQTGQTIGATGTFITGLRNLVTLKPGEALIDFGTTATILFGPETMARFYLKPGNLDIAIRFAEAQVAKATTKLTTGRIAVSKTRRIGRKISEGLSAAQQARRESDLINALINVGVFESLKPETEPDPRIESSRKRLERLVP